MRMYPNVIRNCINVSTAAGGSEHRANLSSLNARPKGRFPYVTEIEVQIAGTLTETGSATLAFLDVADLLQQFTLQYGGHTRFSAYRGLSLYRRSLQIDEQLSSSVRSSFLKVVDVAHSGSGVIDQKYRIQLAPFFGRKGASIQKKLNGAIPLASLVNSGEMICKIKSDPISGSGGNQWDVNASKWTITAHLYTVELDRPIVPTKVREYEHVGDEQRVPLVGSGARRITGLLVADDEQAALTVPTSFSIITDGVESPNGQNGDEWIDTHNVVRETAINALLPKAVPIVTTVGKDLDECPVCMSSYVLQDVAAQHSGSVRVLMRVHEDLTYDEKKDTLRLMGLDESRINQAMAEIEADSGDLSVAYDDMGNPATFYDKNDPSNVGASPIVIKP